MFGRFWLFDAHSSGVLQNLKGVNYYDTELYYYYNKYRVIQLCLFLRFWVRNRGHCKS